MTCIFTCSMCLSASFTVRPVVYLTVDWVKIRVYLVGKDQIIIGNIMTINPTCDIIL